MVRQSIQGQYKMAKVETLIIFFTIIFLWASNLKTIKGS